MKKIAIKIAQMIYNNNPELSEYDRIKMQYGIECFLHEFTKIFAFLLFFSLFSLLHEYILVLAFMLTLRPVLGGYHSRTSWGCYLESLVFLTVIILLGRFIEVNIWIKLISAACSIVFVCLYAPVEHPNKPNNDMNLRKKFKILSVIITIVAFIVSALLPGYYSNIGFLTIVGVVLLAIIGKIIYRGNSTNHSN